MGCVVSGDRRNLQNCGAQGIDPTFYRIIIAAGQFLLLLTSSTFYMVDEDYDMEFSLGWESRVESRHT